MTATQKAPSPDLIDQLLAGYQKPEDLLSEHGLLKQLTKAVVECALQAEMAVGMTNMNPLPIFLVTPATGLAERS
jgi:putative transposase